MTVCAACGDCCDPVVLTQSSESIRDLLEREPENPDARFIAEHWTEVDLEEAARIRPGTDAVDCAFFVCDRFDPESRLCTAHEDRPPVCRGFPWYGDPPEERGPARLTGLDRCSFWRDLPSGARPPGVRPLIPLRVVA